VTFEEINDSVVLKVSLFKRQNDVAYALD